ncbi:hypothetical protein T05_4148 [Trichinella murrelli]|uniref:Uncharacterized protein n=1 Tax=Trichinella murrelli TaxID=144512 RepID=A0A0V0TX20_9BILA|nr:hypothetical protein T05_4148 [Trichinella murrelli]
MTRPSRLLVLLEPAKAWLKIRISYRNRRFGGRDDVISKESISLPERDQPPPFSLDLP